MSDESSDNEQTWWMPADQPDPADRDELKDQAGWMRSTRPIGPLGLRSRSRRPYILAGVAVAALLGGAGAAVASTDSGTPAAPSSVVATPAPSPGQPGAMTPGGRHFGGRSGFGGGLFGALHGQFVMAKPGGGYQTVDVQNGQVTAVSSTSITLKSSDGFIHSYTISGSTVVDAQRDGIGSVKVGNQAAVVATVSGSTATAANVEDLTLVQQGHSGFGFGPGRPGSSHPQAG